MLNYVEKSQNTGLEHLTDSELLQYYALVVELNKTGTRHARIHLEHIDSKKMYHIVRLLLEVEQILAEGDLTLDRNSEILKSIRRGEWELERLQEWFDNKEKSLETLYVSSNIPYQPNEQKIKQVLMECLEMHYDSLSSAIKIQPDIDTLINEMQSLIDKYK